MLFCLCDYVKHVWISMDFCFFMNLNLWLIGLWIKLYNLIKISSSILLQFYYKTDFFSFSFCGRKCGTVGGILPLRVILRPVIKRFLIMLYYNDEFNLYNLKMSNFILFFNHILYFLVSIRQSNLFKRNNILIDNDEIKAVKTNIVWHEKLLNHKYHGKWTKRYELCEF